MNKDKNYEKLQRKSIAPDMTVNDGFTPIGEDNSPASTVNPKTGTSRPPIRDPWAAK